MRRETFIFLILLLLLCIATITLSLVSLTYNIIKKGLLISYIAFDSISAIYIIYRFFHMKTIFYITYIIKHIVFIFNIANIGVIIYSVFYTNEILPKNKVMIFILYEIIMFMKMYIHITSMIRDDNTSLSSDNSCILNINYEQRGNYNNDYEINKNRRYMDELKEENIKLRKERELLTNKRDYMISKIKEINKAKYKNIKIDIVCNYLKSKYETNVTKDLLYNKLFSKIKGECGLCFDKNKYEEIIIDYIKERISLYFKCPLTHQIFSNPYISPEGQTFDKNAIFKLVQQNGRNPVTKNKLEINELYENKLVLDIAEILNLNYDYFSIKAFEEIKKLLISKETGKYFENPIVNINTNSQGTTKEGSKIEINAKYQNLIIKNLIEQNREILDDNFLKFDFDISDNNNIIIHSNNNRNNNNNNINNESSERKEFKKFDKIIDNEDSKKNVNINFDYNTNNIDTEDKKILGLRRLPSE